MNQLRTIVLLGVLSAVLIGIGGALGPAWLYGFTALALAINLASYFFSDRIMLAMHRARELPPGEAPGVHRVVEEVAHAAGIPKPRVYLIPQAQPNAFATGRNPGNGVVAFTEGILRILDERELRGVVAHELGHIRNRDILVATIAAGIAGAITWIAHAARFAALFGGGQHAGVESVPAGVQPATASLFIVSPLSGGSLLALFSTHPPIEQRIARLRAARPALL